MLASAAILLALAGWCRSQAPQSSPCPNVFKYESAGGGQGRWYGVISLPANSLISSLWLNIAIDDKTQSQKSSSEDVTISENMEFKIEHIKKISFPTPATEVRFYVNYNSKLMTPRVADIRLNDKDICNVKSGRPVTANNGNTKQEKGTFYWIKLIGSQEAKPTSRPVNSLNTLPGKGSPNMPDTSSWVSYISGSQPASPSTQSPSPALTTVDQVRNRDVTSSESTKTTIKHMNMRITPTPETDIQFSVHYDPNLKFSTVTDISLNGKEICKVEVIQPASKSPVINRGTATTVRTTTLPNESGSWISYIASRDTATVIGRSAISSYTSTHDPPLEKISPLANTASGRNAWTSYISEQPAPDRRSDYQEQGGQNDWMSYISGAQPESPNVPVTTTQKPNYPVNQVRAGGNTDFLIDHVEMRIYPAPATDIWFNVQYNLQLNTPKAVEIKLNGRDICNIGIAIKS